MKKLMHILFLSCLKATELIEKNMHFKLSLREKLQLKMHKAMCNACSAYEKQSILIEKGISSQEDNAGHKPGIDMDHLKTSILNKLEKQ